jgi:hypothetical protein
VVFAEFGPYKNAPSGSRKRRFSYLPFIVEIDGFFDAVVDYGDKGLADVQRKRLALRVGQLQGSAFVLAGPVDGGSSAVRDVITRSAPDLDDGNTRGGVARDRVDVGEEDDDVLHRDLV